MSGVTGPNLVTDGLIMYLDAGNAQSYSGSGNTWYDLSGNGYDATINGTNHWVSTDGGWFDRANDTQNTNYVALEADAAQATGAYYTIEFWMWPHTPSTTGYWNSMASSGNDNYNIYNQLTSSKLGKYTGTGDISYTSREKFILTVVRNNSDTGSWYKNGALATTMTATTIFTGVADGGWILDQEQDSIGGGFQVGQNYRGGFAQVRLYNRVLTAAEITQKYNAHKSRYGL